MQIYSCSNTICWTTTTKIVIFSKLICRYNVLQVRMKVLEHEKVLCSCKARHDSNSNPESSPFQSDDTNQYQFIFWQTSSREKSQSHPRLNFSQSIKHGMTTKQRSDVKDRFTYLCVCKISIHCTQDVYKLK